MNDGAFRQWHSIADLEYQGAILEIQDGNHGESHPKASEYTTVGIPFVMASDLRGGFVDLQNCKLLPKERIDKLRIGFARTGDLLLSHKGSVGRVAIVPVVDPYIMLTPQITYYRVDEDKICARYLAYAFQAPDFQSQLQTISAQSTRPYVSISTQRHLKVPIVPLWLQRRIASILSAYDNLIENNTRRIAILEEMARALYQEWFVHFRFPGHEHVPLVDSALGPIPVGWECARLGEGLAELESGSRPKGGIGDQVDGIPSIGAENVLGLGKYDYSKDKFVSRQFYERMKRGKVKSWDVLLYKDGAHIGRRSLFAENFPHVECCINEHVFILRTNRRLCQSYLYFWLDRPENERKVRGTNANAAQPGLNQSGIRGLQILFPAEEILGAFDRFVTPMLKAIFNMAKRSRLLRETRDLLLPKLISGEIDVSQLPERPIAEAAD